MACSGPCGSVGANVVAPAARSLAAENLVMSRYNPVDMDILIRYNLGAIETLFSEQLVRAIMKSEYLKLADTIAAEIADGTLKAGDRLPPQRNFAWERKIAVSTASRVYSELLRRGLVVGEVGRGTFISGDAKRGVAAPSEVERHPDRPRVQLSLAPRSDRVDRKEHGRPADGRGARIRFAAGDQRSERRHSAASRPPICRRAHGRLRRISWCSPATDGRALPQHLPAWCPPAAVAASSL